MSLGNIAYIEYENKSRSGRVHQYNWRRCTGKSQRADKAIVVRHAARSYHDMELSDVS